MPFDSFDFPHDGRSQRPTGGGAIFTAVLAALAVVLLLFPISLPALVDLILYLRAP